MATRPARPVFRASHAVRTSPLWTRGVTAEHRRSSPSPLATKHDQAAVIAPRTCAVWQPSRIRVAARPVLRGSRRRGFYGSAGELGNWPGGTIGAVISDTARSSSSRSPTTSAQQLDPIQVAEPRRNLIAKHSAPEFSLRWLAAATDVELAERRLTEERHASFGERRGEGSGAGEVVIVVEGVLTDLPGDADAAGR